MNRTARVRKIAFGLFSPDEIRHRSVVKVENIAIYEKNLPKNGGINDHLMGTTDRKIKCGTCKHSVENCNGHEGHIELGWHVYLIGYINTILKTLRLVCFFCSRIIVDVDNDPQMISIIQQFKGKQRLTAMSNAFKTRHECFHCKSPVPMYRRNGINLDISWPENTEWQSPEEETFCKRPFTAKEAHNILLHVTDQDAERMGYNVAQSRPSYMITDILIVPPPIIRPSISITEGSRARGQDDLTHKLQDIIKANIALNQQKAKDISSNAVSDPEKLEVTKSNDKPAKKTKTTKAAKPKETKETKTKKTTKKDQKDQIDQQQYEDYEHHKQQEEEDYKEDVIMSRNDLVMADPPLTKELLAKIQELQFHVATYINNDIRGQKQALQRSGAPIRSLKYRIQGKSGRVRGNLMGKRVDYSSRSVVTPDCFMNLDEVGVPEEVAMTLTFPEVVQSFNFRELWTRVRNGPKQLFGAKIVEYPDGSKVHLEFCQNLNSIRLSVGCIVHRHLKNGDYVIFNRHPSLHKKSVMVHRVRIMKDQTFRLNPVCCTPYNADFDGDEMNIHVPQSHEAMAECRELLYVATQLLSPQSNKPAFGPVQDVVVGLFLLTGKDTLISRDRMMSLIMQVQHVFDIHDEIRLPKPAILKPKPLWTGKQLFSMLLPGEMNLKKQVRQNADKINEFDLKERMIVIEKGELVCGSVCKQTSNGAGGIVHLLAKDQGFQWTINFISDLQRLVNYFLALRGFSVGLGDCLIQPDTEKKVQRVLQCSFANISKLIKEADQLNMSNTAIEPAVTRKLCKVLDHTGRITQSCISENNNLLIMVTSGSKGNPINISQIMACVGQQSIEGKRIHAHGLARKSRSVRTLNNYADGDESPAVHGFVENSYTLGLRPDEFFFHCMGGREGLVDTAVKTATTGYTQRRLVKAMESCCVAFDGSVRDSNGQIIQISYGNDAMDSDFLERNNLEIVHMTNQQLQDYVCYDLTKEKDTEEVQQSELSVLKELRDRCRDEKQTIFSNDLDGTCYLPFNVSRWAYKYGNVNSKPVSTSPTEIKQRVDKLVQQIKKVQGHNSTFLFLITSIHFHLCTKQVIFHWKLTMDQLDKLCDKLLHIVQKSRSQPGEMVGALSANSIGEPLTQLTLNTFHYSGVGSKNVTLGVPRMKELFEVSKKIKTPCTTVFLKPPINQNFKAVDFLKNTLVHTVLLDVVTSQSQILHEPNRYSTSIEDDKIMVELANFFRLPNDLDDSSEYIIRLVLNKTLLTSKNLNPVDVAKIIEDFSGGMLDIVYSETNMLQWVIRLRIKNITDKTDKLSNKEDQLTLEQSVTQTLLSHLMNNVFISGIAGIRSATIREISSKMIDEETGAIRTQKEWVIDTLGTCLSQIWTLDFVDWQRTISNDVTEVGEVLGIEAAFAVLFHEINNVLSMDGSYVNERHIQMVADTMTFRGWLMPVTRHGINRVDSGPLLRSSFEETVEILFDASAFGEVDAMQGVTENIMLGQLAPMGTGQVRTLTKVVAKETKTDSLAKAEAAAETEAESRPLKKSRLIITGVSEISSVSPTPGFSSFSSFHSFSVPSTPPINHLPLSQTFSGIQQCVNTNTMFSIQSTTLEHSGQRLPYYESNEYFDSSYQTGKNGYCILSDQLNQQTEPTHYTNYTNSTYSTDQINPIKQNEKGRNHYVPSSPVFYLEKATSNMKQTMMVEYKTTKSVMKYVPSSPQFLNYANVCSNKKH